MSWITSILKVEISYGNVRPVTVHEGPQKHMYSSTLSLTSALDATPRLLYPRERQPVPKV